MTTLLMCGVCREGKAPEEFYRSRTRKTGRQYACKACSKAHTYDWRAVNPERAAEHRAAYEERNPGRQYNRSEASVARTRAHNREWYALNKDAVKARRLARLALQAAQRTEPAGAMV